MVVSSFIGNAGGESLAKRAAPHDWCLLRQLKCFAKYSAVAKTEMAWSQRLFAVICATENIMFM